MAPAPPGALQGHVSPQESQLRQGEPGRRHRGPRVGTGSEIGPSVPFLSQTAPADRDVPREEFLGRPLRSPLLSATRRPPPPPSITLLPQQCPWNGAWQVGYCHQGWQDVTLSFPKLSHSSVASGLPGYHTQRVLITNLAGQLQLHLLSGTTRAGRVAEMLHKCHHTQKHPGLEVETVVLREGVSQLP